MTTFPVRSEQTTTAMLAFVPAFAVTFPCALGQTPARDDLLLLVVRDASGVLCDCVQLHLAIEPAQWRTLLPPGAYAVTTRANDGRQWTTQVTVRESLTAQAFDLVPVR